MDIQVASNFERLLYYFFEGNSSKVVEVMRNFREEGRFIETFALKGFSSVSTGDHEIPELIKMVSEQYAYLVDPHTACAFKDLDPEKAVVLATAHPAKFPSVYKDAGMEIPLSPTLEKLKSIEPVSYEVSVNSQSIRSFIFEKTGNR